MRLPVYSQGPTPLTLEQRRAREMGALAISLRLEPMLREALQGRILEYLHVHIRDLGAEPGQDEVFSTAAAPAAGDALQVRRVDFGGRRWELRTWPRSPAVDTRSCT